MPILLAVAVLVVLVAVGVTYLLTRPRHVIGRGMTSDEANEICLELPIPGGRHRRGLAP